MVLPLDRDSAGSESALLGEDGCGTWHRQRSGERRERGGARPGLRLDGGARPRAFRRALELSRGPRGAGGDAGGDGAPRTPRGDGARRRPDRQARHARSRSPARRSGLPSSPRAQREGRRSRPTTRAQPPSCRSPPCSNGARPLAHPAGSRAPSPRSQNRRCHEIAAQHPCCRLVRRRRVAGS